MRLRVAVAVCVLVSALVHLQLWWGGLSAVPVIGPAFLLNAAGGGVLAVAVLAWRSWLPLLGAVGFGAATLAAFAVSVTVGLFGVQERLLGVPQVVAAVSEVAAVVLGLWALSRERRSGAVTPPGPRRPRPAGRRPPAGAAPGR
jgi:hypothetical protein